MATEVKIKHFELLHYSRQTKSDAFTNTNLFSVYQFTLESLPISDLFTYEHNAIDKTLFLQHSCGIMHVCITYELSGRKEACAD